MRRRRGLVLVVGLLACGSVCLLALDGRSKKKTTDELLIDLKKGNEKERNIAVRTLSAAEGDAEKVIPVLIESLRDADHDVRHSAALRLGYYGERGLLGEHAQDAVAALVKRLHDGDARVREAAGKALTRIDPEKFPTPPHAAKTKTN